MCKEELARPHPDPHLLTECFSNKRNMHTQVENWKIFKRKKKTNLIPKPSCPLGVASGGPGVGGEEDKMAADPACDACARVSLWAEDHLRVSTALPAALGGPASARTCSEAGLPPAFASLCRPGLGQARMPLCASVSPSVTWGW